MKLLKYITGIVGAVALLSACSKEDSADVSKVLRFEIKGDNPMLVVLNTSYKEEGCSVNYGGEDYTGRVQIDGTVDPNTVGYYPMTYWFKNNDGVKTSRVRKVYVANPKITTDFSGSYITIDGTKRNSGGTLTPFPNFKIEFKRLAPGFFQVSDFLGGYYDQRAGYGSLYAATGTIQLKEDNTLSLLSVVNPPFGGSPKLTEFKNAKYDPTEKTVSWDAVFGGMTFSIICKLTD